ncbi:hypothetical protein FH972_024579 [Carpinus fangiana]|uniref:DAD domain-containing protein n=1 Tax=Carpinus fangiana TaxID=176857 RepID=A0A5N6KYE4_9ROSI|nr:hypothetical protein FH972_024579 [Carpinus fangiana]
MPGRVAARAPRGSRAKATEPAQEVPDEGPSSSLREAVVSVFTDVQRQNTGHRKLVVTLRKIQEACCYEPQSNKKRAFADDFDESEFNSEVARCLLRVLPVKKTEPVGDRIIRFLAMFLKHAIDLEQDEDGMDIIPETPSSRLGFQIISMLLPLLPAKDKVVRFRTTQIVARLVNTLESIDDELFQHIRLGMLKRLRDKESNVRVQAVFGLGRLANEGEAEQDEDDSDDETAGGVLERLVDVLQNDPSAEVRRTLLVNLPLTPTTLPFLLERARDMDPGLRRALYGRILPGLGDFRHLSLTHREKLLRWGLRDRDENVRKATAKLFRERWIEDCARPRDENGVPVEMQPGQFSEPSSEGLLELLERIDVINAVRTFNDFCHRDGASDLLQDKIPEVTRLAFLLQSSTNTLVELVQKLAVEEGSEEDSVAQEFIVEQLLHIALTLDYSDEVGRRTMFSLMREALALADLPEETTRLVVEVLRMTCGQNPSAERDFCGVVLEAIAEVHDTIMGDEPEKEDDPDDSFHSARSDLSSESTPKKQMDQEVDEEKLIREIMVNMKCLHIAQCMLQNVNCQLEDNAHLVTMLNNLVVPAVKSVEAPIRERGFLCLGLCCLLDKNLAEQNLPLFLHCYQKGHLELQNIAIQVIGDILASHPSMLLTPVSPGEGEEAVPDEHPLHKPVHKMFSKALKSPEPSLQTTACTALCKLMLSAPSNSSTTAATILNTEELLKLLVIAYFDPDSTANPALRQALSYFIPVYCHSRRDNMQRMGRIALSILNWCVGIKEEMDVEVDVDGAGEMVGMAVVISHLVDWTDGRKLAAATNSLSEDAAKDADGDVHLDVATEILEKVLGVCSKDERKLYISMLGKLYITSNSGKEKLEEVSRLLQEAIDDRVASDAPTRNAFTKVEASLAKALLGPGERSPQKRTARQSVAPSTIDEDDGDGVGPPVSTPPSGEDAASVNLDESEMAALNLDSTLTTPTTSPRKSARARKITAPTVSYAEPEDSTILEEDEKENQDPTPVPSPRKTSGRARKLPTAAASVKTQPEPKDVDITDAPATEEARVKTGPASDEDSEITVMEEEQVRKAAPAPRATRGARAPAQRKSVRASRRGTLADEDDF